MATSHCFGVYKDAVSLYMLNDFQYIPILLDEIIPYTKLPGYKDDCIKHINTVGILKSINFSEMLLRSLYNYQKTEIKLDIQDLYSGVDFVASGINPKDFFNRAVRVFGCLTTQDGEIVIRVQHCLTMDSVNRCERILRLRTLVARQNISSYQYDVPSPEISYYIEIENQRKAKLPVDQIYAEENLVGKRIDGKYYKQLWPYDDEDFTDYESSSDDSLLDHHSRPTTDEEYQDMANWAAEQKESDEQAEIQDNSKN